MQRRWHKNTLDKYSFRSRDDLRSTQTFSTNPSRNLDFTFTPKVKKLKPNISVSKSPILRRYLNKTAQSTPRNKSQDRTFTILKTPKKGICTTPISINKTSPRKIRYINSTQNFNSISPSRTFNFRLGEPGSYVTMLKGMPILEEIKNFREKSSSRNSEISKKHYNDLSHSVTRAVTKLKADKEDLSSISFEEPYRHSGAREYFRLIKSGLYEKLLEVLDSHTELISSVDTVTSTQTQQTGLHWAAKRNNLKITKLLVSRNIKIYALDMMGRKAEDIALKRGNIDVYNYLLSLKNSEQDQARKQQRKKMRRQLLLPSKTLIAETLAGRAKKSSSFSLPRAETKMLSPASVRTTIKRHSMVHTTGTVFHFKTAQGQ